MGRCSYNRAGNRTGYGRGGRGSGADDSSGSGEDGRGNGSGFHPRGGRTRNHRQRYNNRPQEQYGGGRGGGGGQQTSRARTYSRQSADHLPDRSGPGREARTWYRRGSGEPVDSRSRALTQTESGLAGLRLKINVSATMDLIIPRILGIIQVMIVVGILTSTNGALAVKSVRLLVNHFPVMFDPSSTILRYDMDVKHEGSSSSGPMRKAIPKSHLWLIQGKLCSDYPDQFPLPKTAFDGEKNVFSAVLLHPGSYKVQLFGRSYVWIIKFVNLGLKIIAKLGGSNVELIEWLPCFHCDEHFMFMGAEVNRPAASNTLSPSTAAVVGSVNSAATRYAGRVSPQSHHKEKIVDFWNMCLDLVNAYAWLNGVTPNKIVGFCDGICNGQFDMVLNKEMMMELQSCGYPSSVEQFFCNLEHRLKDSMLFV